MEYGKHYLKRTATSQNQVMRVGLFHRISEFRRDERGNDLLELALVVAFVLLGSTALYTGAGADVHGMLQYPGREVVHVHNG